MILARYLVTAQAQATVAVAPIARGASECGPGRFEAALRSWSAHATPTVEDDGTTDRQWMMVSGEERRIDEASASGCDLVVLGTQGRTGLDRLLMRSMAEAVIRRAGCAILAVKAPAPVSSPSASGTSTSTTR
jgi:hypothetical protein